jgi:flagellin-like protein
MKGVSPMIAVVLLIAFTVAIGGIISIWLTSLASTQTSTVSSQAEKQIKCASSTITIKEAKYTNMSSLVNITVTHETGTEKLYNLSIEVSGGGFTSRNMTTGAYAGGIYAFNTTGDPFERGASIQLSINTSIGSATIPPEYVRARVYCQTDIAIVAECKSGQSCMKSV